MLQLHSQNVRLCPALRKTLNYYICSGKGTNGKGEREKEKEGEEIEREREKEREQNKEMTKPAKIMLPYFPITKLGHGY